MVLLVASNAYLARHHQVFVVSGYEHPLEVTVPGAGSVSFTGPGHRVLEVPEGTHRAVVTGATNQEIEFEVASNFRGRFFNAPARLLNPGGAALIVVETAVYAGSEHPQGGGEDDGDIQLLYGRTFEKVEGVDYWFEPFPDQVTIADKSGRTIKRRIDQLTRDPLLVFYTLSGRKRTEDALALAEWWLTLHPDRSDMLPAYWSVGNTAQWAGRVREFLRRGAAARPVRVPWHRMYQESSVESLDALVAEYDAHLASDPDNPAWLYLRGRLAGRCSESMPYMRRAVEAKTDFAFGWYALGMAHASRGEWESARSMLARAVEAEPGEAMFGDALFDARMALKEWADLETELRGRLAEDPLLPVANLQLTDVLMAEGKFQETRLLLENLAMRSMGLSSTGGRDYIPALLFRCYYSAGQFAAMIQLGTTQPRSVSERPVFQALIELGRAESAVEWVGIEDPRLVDPFHFLAVALAWELGSRPDQALEWSRRALAELGRSREEHRLTAAMLSGDQPPAREVFIDLALPAHSKALLAALLARKFPSEAPSYAELVRTLNVSREYPFHLVNRAVAAW